MKERNPKLHSTPTLQPLSIVHCVLDSWEETKSVHIVMRVQGMKIPGRTWELTPVIPALWEAEVGRSRETKSSRLTSATWVSERLCLGASWALSNPPSSCCRFSPADCLSREASQMATAVLASALAERLLWNSLLADVPMPSQ
ncbi:hypothetical protein AAY473_014448 [Plecturocebus cupreus]